MADKNGNKTGGRKKGVPNKKTLNLEERLKELGFDPVAKLIEGIEAQPPYQAVETIIKMWEFIYPKRKHVEASITTDEDLKALLIQKLKE